jgi:hypothetical protein
MFAKKRFALVFGALLGLLACLAGCAPQGVNAVPNLPAGYYSAVQVNPQELINAYFYAGLPDYIDIREPEARYNNKVYIFKDVLIDEYAERELDKGWLWLDLIKCPVANIDAMKDYAIGDRIDVVGLNLGPEDPRTTGLTFTNCYVLPPNSMGIPAGDTGDAVVTAY